MHNLFGHEYDPFPFSPYSFSHFFMITMLIIGSVLIYYFREFLRKHDKTARIIMFVSLFLFETLYHIWLYKDGYWDISFTLPLQLCSLSLILCLILLYTQCKIIFQIVFFIGISGAFMAILTPELFLGFPHFRYFQFFITHILIIWTCLYFLFIHQLAPTRRGMLSSFLFLNLSAVCAYIANKITNGNYMFLASKPTNGSLLDYFGPFPLYILALEVSALILFFLLFLICDKVIMKVIQK
ncbi:TIGR02206 family membrane protein [Bacillus sp. FJAT-49705]|uniref:TIGR02206 family membrane protein n=1 Tax=Cytobacillus citreus TaxID=2833586 RepID=A0ABS5NQF1_9BACI|nr:TIGR02206 family membrane protein [Cytobacillus citreus]MBS4189363.1 TIGR02206 family membrane protein [Cytobacillus citreus]